MCSLARKDVRTQPRARAKTPTHTPHPTRYRRKHPHPATRRRRGAATDNTQRREAGLIPPNVGANLSNSRSMLADTPCRAMQASCAWPVKPFLVQIPTILGATYIARRDGADCGGRQAPGPVNSSSQDQHRDGAGGQDGRQKRPTCLLTPASCPSQPVALETDDP